MGALGITGGVLDSVAAITGPLGADAAELLTGRAALLGLAGRGRVSAGGATRLLAASDSWCALTLSRPDDLAAVPALLAADTVGVDPWPEVTQWAATQTAAAITDRARLLGLPASMLGETAPAAPRIVQCGETAAPRSAEGLLVADLTSMWAGPLCGQLLARAGARVVKVESPARPDGTRTGEPVFFDWMHAGKLCYAVDFDSQRERLAALLAVADVVLEGSRPVGLGRRRLGPSDIAARPGRVWVRISGYGSAGERANWVAFGDDAAVAGGLVGDDGAGPTFTGDAIADPLTGVAATAAVLESLARGGGELIEIAMAEVAATFAVASPVPDQVVVMSPPRVPQHAHALGADNAEVEQLITARAEREGRCRSHVGGDIRHPAC